MLSVADLADRCFLVWMASCGAALIIAYLGLRMAKTRHLCFGHLDVIVELSLHQRRMAGMNVAPVFHPTQIAV